MNAMPNNQRNLFLVIFIVFSALIVVALSSRHKNPVALQPMSAPSIDTHWKELKDFPENVGEHDGEIHPMLQDIDVFQTLASSLTHHDYENAYSLFSLDVITKDMVNPDYQNIVFSWGDGVSLHGAFTGLDLVSSTVTTGDYTLQFHYRSGISKTVIVKLNSKKEIITLPSVLLQQLQSSAR
jgi:hypothetical protein